MATTMDVDSVLVSDGDSDDELELCQEEVEEDDSDTDSDPTFDLVNETEKAFSNLSIKKTKPRIAEEQEHEEGDSKSFEAVEKLIKDGKLNKLKVDHCKVYLKQHGLRRTGKKDILLNRIKEHLDLKDGNGEKKYPVSSFTLNCQGDACLGDVVMFEQKVYEMFSIASRSATGPPIGKRTVAGRIVNESYGEAKQQHTFTIEVLWSKGEKPLPPLHPLLIKGRNLYKLKTMRQQWDNEEERKKILQEKHERGNLARLSRERRIHEKEMRKTQKENRKMKQSHGTLSSKPIPKLQDVTNLTNRQKPQENLAPKMQPHIERNPPTRHNHEFMLSGGSHQRPLKQPQTVQSEGQLRRNRGLDYPNTGYAVQPRIVQSETQMRHNRGLDYPNSGYIVQPRTVQSEAQVRPNRGLDHPNSRYTVQPQIVQGEAQMRRNHGLDYSNSGYTVQPRTVQSEAPMRRNHGLEYPNSGYTVQPRTVQSETQMRHNHGSDYPNSAYTVQPRTVQSEEQMRRNHGLVYPNSGHTVQAVGRNISVSGPPHQWSNGYNRQVPQQDPRHLWDPQRQVTHGYDVHGPAHYGRGNAQPVSGQLCLLHMKGQCRFGHACMFRHE